METRLSYQLTAKGDALRPRMSPTAWNFGGGLEQLSYAATSSSVA